MKVVQAGGGTASTLPAGFFESRTATVLSRAATSGHHQCLVVLDPAGFGFEIDQAALELGQAGLAGPPAVFLGASHQVE